MPRSKTDELIDYIVDGFKILVIAGVCIYASYHIIKIIASLIFKPNIKTPS